VQKRYVQHEASQIVNTSWVVLSLLQAGFDPRDERITKAIKFILSRQEPNGDWPQESISGVFNFNCMITYTAYRNVFPVWALSRYFSLLASSSSSSSSSPPSSTAKPFTIATQQPSGSSGGEGVSGALIFKLFLAVISIFIALWISKF